MQRCANCTALTILYDSSERGEKCVDCVFLCEILHFGLCLTMTGHCRCEFTLYLRFICSVRR